MMPRNMGDDKSRFQNSNLASFGEKKDFSLTLRCHDCKTHHLYDNPNHVHEGGTTTSTVNIHWEIGPKSGNISV